MIKEIDGRLITDDEVIEIMADDKKVIELIADYKKVIEVLSVCFAVYFHETGGIDDKMAKVFAEATASIASMHDKSVKTISDDIRNATKAIFIKRFITVH